MEGLISVIIPVYNCEKYIKKCVESILNQTYKNLEILIVDDGSTDNSLEICKDIQSHDKRVKVIHQNNQGVSSARNNGIKKALGEYISFIDSDDWIHERYYEILVGGYEKNNVDLSVVGVISVNNLEYKNDDIDFSYEIIDKQQAYNKIFTDKNFFGFPVNKLYKKNIIDKISENAFDEKIYACEDTLFNVKYLSFCKNISYNASKVYFYYQRQDSATKIQKFSERKITVFKSLNEINKIYKKECPQNLECLYEFYMYNYFLIELLIKKTKCGYNLKQNECNVYYKYLMKSNKISFFKKIKICIKYRFPSLFDYIRKLKRG